MGYNSSSSTVSIVAKLTPYGRTALVSNNSSLISSFSLGDSDANYYATLALTTGQVPAEAGEVGPNSTVSNSTTQKVSLKSVLIINGKGALRKPVEINSSVVSSEILANGQVSISGANVTKNVVLRSDFATDSLVNLFYSFGLPLNTNDDVLMTGTTYANGGFSDTAYSGFAQNKVLILGFNNSTYGESIDGKELKIVLPTTAGTFTCYSTFENKGSSTRVEDTSINDSSINASKIGSNIAFLFSDTIKTPNGGVGSLSWGTGFGSVKPFSLNGKQLFNFQTNDTLAQYADMPVGIAYLDKGFAVITHPTILAAYDSATASGTVVTFNSVSTSVFQNITCVANRGEFISSTNKTFGGGDSVRISEVGLYDINGKLVAYGKTDRHVVKNINSPLYLGVKISL